MKFEYNVVHKNSSQNFDNGHCLLKSKVTVGLQSFSRFTAIQMIGPIT